MDYFKKIKYVLEQLWFDYLGVRYQGHGVMIWTPEEGFHIEAFLDKQQLSQSKTIELGRVGIIRKSDTSSIRMRPRGFDWAIAPNVPLIDCLGIILENQLSIDLHRVIFSESGGTGNKNSTWLGSAIYETKNRSALSNFVNTDMWINAQRVGSVSNVSRVWYEDEKNQRISGRMITEKHLELNWRLDNPLWSKTHGWKWPEAAQDALSLWFGEELWLLQREVRRGVQTCTEVKTPKKLGSVGLLTLFDEQHKLDRSIFVKLTEFLVRNEPQATIIHNIFKQLISSQKQNWQTTELLVSTILEAALRSIDLHPFRAKDESWKIDKSLKKFREKHLAKEWKPFCKKAIDTHKELRHRNAHPDWLFSQGGYLSDEQREKSLDDMIFLSRFYGYMILALVGFKDLQPIFPKPLKDYSSSVLIQQGYRHVLGNVPPEFSIVDEQTSALQKQLAEAKTAHARTMVWRRFYNSKTE